MIAFGYLELLSLLTLPVCGVLIYCMILKNNRITSLQSKLDKIQKQYYLLENANEDLQNQQLKNQTFEKNLQEAELTTSLQKPRLSLQKANQHKQGNKDKYQFIQTLSGSGMAAEEIAKVLSISSNEAEQLVNLSKLANTQ